MFDKRKFRLICRTRSKVTRYRPLGEFVHWILIWMHPVHLDEDKVHCEFWWIKTFNRFVVLWWTASPEGTAGQFPSAGFFYGSFLQTSSPDIYVALMLRASSSNKRSARQSNTINISISDVILYHSLFFYLTVEQIWSEL